MIIQSARIEALKKMMTLLGITKRIDIEETKFGTVADFQNSIILVNFEQFENLDVELYGVIIGDIPVLTFFFLHELAHILTMSYNYEEALRKYRTDKHNLAILSKKVGLGTSSYCKLYRLIPFERIADELAMKYYEIITTGQSIDIESFSEEYSRVNYSSYNIEFNEKMESIVENFNQD